MNATATPAKRATTAATQPVPPLPDFAAERQAMADEIKMLRSKISEIDALSQSAFSQIAAVAKLALKALEVPDPYGHNIETLAEVLLLVWGRAETTEDNINAEAESVGCHYVDEDGRSRQAARMQVAAQRRAMSNR